MTDIKPTRLIQRLRAPSDHLEQPFSTTSFFEQRARQALGKLFTLDYMGASEFGFGAVPKAVDQLIANRANLRADKIEITVIPNEYETQRLKRDVQWHERKLNEEDSVLMQADLEKAMAAYDQGKETQNIPIFIIAPENLLPYAKEFISSESQTPHRIKAPTWFRESIIGPHEFKKNLGWFELNNGFFFFRDWKMFDQTAKLFEVQHAIQPTILEIKPVRTDETEKRVIASGQPNGSELNR